MTLGDKSTVEEQPCGCKTISTTIYSRGSYTGPNPIIKYEPCLPCALKNAGLMLQQAGLRIEEQRDAELQDAAEQAEALRVRAEETIGGSD